MTFMTRTECARFLSLRLETTTYLLKKLEIPLYLNGLLVSPTYRRNRLGLKINSQDALSLLHCRMRLEWELASKLSGYPLPPFPLSIKPGLYARFLKTWGQVSLRVKSPLLTGLIDLPTARKVKTTKFWNYSQPKRRRSTNTNSSNSWWDGP